MKTIIDILEKLKVDDIVFEKFPIDGTVEKMIKFLKEQGFIDATESYGSLNDIFNTAKSKCFFIYPDDNTKRIWFVDTSEREICKENPVFFIDPTYKYYEVYYLNSSGHATIIDNSKKAFIEELNKRFGW